MYMFCRSLFVLLSFFDLRILITPNSSSFNWNLEMFWRWGILGFSLYSQILSYLVMYAFISQKYSWTKTPGTILEEKSVPGLCVDAHKQEHINVVWNETNPISSPSPQGRYSLPISITCDRNRKYKSSSLLEKSRGHSLFLIWEITLYSSLFSTAIAYSRPTHIRPIQCGRKCSVDVSGSSEHITTQICVRSCVYIGDLRI